MKNRRLIFLLLLGYSLITSTKSFSQVYSTIEDGLYEIDSYTETLTSYNPPHANIYRGGVLMATPKLGLRVTNNNIETDSQKVHYNGGMKLHIYAPRVNASRSASEEPLPVIVFGYGGGFLSSWDPTKNHKVPQYLARRGYIVVAPEYRIGIDLYDTALAERAIGRAVQDIRVVNKYARTLTNAKYTVDQTKPLTYLGWSSGAFIGLHNLYLRDSNQPASTKAGYSVLAKLSPFLTNLTPATTYSIGTLDLPWMGTSPQPPSSTEDPVQDITVSVSGALGKLEWIVGATVPKALYMIHHPTDAVVPFGTDEAYSGFSLFSKEGWVYPTVNGSNVINNFFANTPSLTPNTYQYKYMDPNCATDDCLKGDAGGEAGPLNKKTWYHDPMENSANLEVMTSIIDFIELAIIEQDPNYARQATVGNEGLLLIEKPTEDLEDENKSLVLYPNPVTEQLTIAFGTLDATSVEIYDYSGKQLLHKNINNGERLLSLNISNYTPGMYLVRIHTANGISVRKIIKK